MFGLTGARVVVTGAGGGIGRVLCAALAREGARVVGCDLAEAVVPTDCAEQLGFDLSDAAAVTRAAARILAPGPPDVVIANAGATRAETLAQTGPDDLTAEMAGNFDGPARLSAALLPAMRGAGGNRSFVFVGSVNAQAHFGNPVYAAAKAATLAWMRAIAVEEGRHGIRANAVIPGSVRTNAWTERLKSDPQILARMSRLYPLGRIVTPKEVADAVLFLASPLASGITGATLNVDAGLMAGNLPFLNAITPETP